MLFSCSLTDREDGGDKTLEATKNKIDFKSVSVLWHDDCAHEVVSECSE
jgi:hypothetical protein